MKQILSNPTTADNDYLKVLVTEINDLFNDRKNYDKIKGEINFNEYFLDLGRYYISGMDVSVVNYFVQKYNGSLGIYPVGYKNTLVIRIPK